MAAARKLIRGGVIVTMDPERGEIYDGEVLIEDGAIAAVGADLGVVDAEVIDAGDMIVLPGFVDTHRHSWQAAMRGVAGDWTLNRYLETFLGELGAIYRPQDVYAGNLISALDAIDSGVTTMLDWSHVMNSPEHADAAVEALRESGLRAVFAHSGPSTDSNAWWWESELTHPDDVRRVRAEHFASDEGLVTMAMALRGPEFATMKTTAHDVSLARELALPMTMHIGVGNLGPMFRAVEHLHEDGLLGPDMTFVHCNACSEEAIRLIADAGATVSISPRVEMQMGHGHPVTGRAIAAGIAPSLSIDLVVGSGGNYFAEMQAALDAERMRQNTGALEQTGEMLDKLDLSIADVLRCATINGARTLGLEGRTGSITPGKDADLIMISGDRLNLTPLNRSGAVAVMSANPGNVDSVFVRGRALKRGGELVGVDLLRIRRLAVESRDHLFAEAGVPEGCLPYTPPPLRLAIDAQTGA